MPEDLFAFPVGNLAEPWPLGLLPQRSGWPPPGDAAVHRAEGWRAWAGLSTRLSMPDPAPAEVPALRLRVSPGILGHPRTIASMTREFLRLVSDAQRGPAGPCSHLWHLYVLHPGHRPPTGGGEAAMLRSGGDGLKPEVPA